MMLFSDVIQHPEFIAWIRGSSPNQRRNEAILRGLNEAAALPWAGGRPVGALRIADMEAAYALLGMPKPEDYAVPGANPDLFRRKVCWDIARAVRAAVPDVPEGQISGALSWFEGIQVAWCCLADKRLAALGAGAEWALAELRLAGASDGRSNGAVGRA